MDHIHNKPAALARLRKAEGQIRGIINMVESDRECEDVVTQISAVTSAMRNIARLILNDHIAHCVQEGVDSGDTESTIVSLIDIFDQYSKVK